MNGFMKMKEWFKNHMPTKRRLIQLYSALLFNSYIKGYITGDIFKGLTKNVCTPGLNCYSCPGAVTSCPMGALQNAFAASGKTTPYYMLGIIMLYSILFGRWICGWLCPFGLIQDLLHKIKTPKVTKNFVTRALSFFKYIILAVFVVIIPLVYMIKDLPLPAFCKYICPAGTLGGAISLLINPNNDNVYEMLGPLFTWKFALMVSIIVTAIFIYRCFCRFLCPLGAIYGFFNKISVFGIKLEKDKCIDCGKCISICEMDINHVGDHECIHCGKCVGVCPTKAISYKGAKIILPDSELEKANTDEERAEIELKREKRMKTVRLIITSILALVLCASLVYCNFIVKDETIDPPVTGGDTSDVTVGSEIGNKCPSYSLDLVDGSGKINIDDLKGKIVIVNFWGVWCTPCKMELPDFNKVATEYKDNVVVLTIHTHLNKSQAPDYIENNFPGSDMLFAYDIPLNSTSDMYFTLLGGTSYYPRTLILDENGIIQFTRDGIVEHEELVKQIEDILSK